MALRARVLEPPSRTAAPVPLAWRAGTTSSAGVYDVSRPDVRDSARTNAAADHDHRERGPDEREPCAAGAARRANANTTSPSASARYDERECVQSSPAKSSADERAARAASIRPRSRSRDSHAAATSSATTSRYERRERREERRHEPPQRLLVARVVDQVLGQAGEALVREAELLARTSRVRPSRATTGAGSRRCRRARTPPRRPR